MIQPFQIVEADTDLEQYSAIIDVRSPKEFAEDHIPGAVNLPVLNNQERTAIGTLYKENAYEARLRGAIIVSRNIASHIETTLSRHNAEFTPLIYCWRGGLRSNSMATVLKSIGWHVHLIEGGYQSFRKHVLSDLDVLMSTQNYALKVLAGSTGVGKTKLLKYLREQGAQVIDLEGLANHRGSLLGSPYKGKQPTQKLFESRLWNVLRTLDPARPVFIEAESNRIGSIHLPPPFWSTLPFSEVLKISMPIQERISLTKEDYHHFVEDPDALIQLLHILRRIRGNEQVDTWCELIRNGKWEEFLQSILENHYDLAYRPPGSEKSKYPKATHHFTIQSNTAEDYHSTARSILQLDFS